MAREQQGPSRRARLFLRSLVAGLSQATSTEVRLRIRPGEENQGETQPGMAGRAMGTRRQPVGRGPAPRPMDRPGSAASVTQVRSGTPSQTPEREAWHSGP